MFFICLCVYPVRRVVEFIDAFPYIQHILRNDCTRRLCVLLEYEHEVYFQCICWRWLSLYFLRSISLPAFWRFVLERLVNGIVAAIVIRHRKRIPKTLAALSEELFTYSTDIRDFYQLVARNICKCIARLIETVASEAHLPRVVFVMSSWHGSARRRRRQRDDGDVATASAAAAAAASSSSSPWLSTILPYIHCILPQSRKRNRERYERKYIYVPVGQVNARKVHVMFHITGYTIYNSISVYNVHT